jgi:protocatechuate 3,4-dioxygenase beta subunit
MALRDDDHAHHGGLAHDLRVISRRRLMGLIARGAAGLSLIPVIASCTDDSGAGPDAAAGTDATGTGACSAIPEETGGPYPGDGTNGPNVLTLDGVVRSDLRTSFAGMTGTAAGVVLTVTLTILDASTCAPVAGRAVYLWHCDQGGNYSLYSPGVTDQNYLRGVQISDADGKVAFTTIFPACYAGRWPHIHFEVHASAAVATSGARALTTSQLALPRTACDAVYATSGYGQSVSNLAQVSLASDLVFGDGSALQVPTMTGSVADGYGAALTVAVRAS